MEQSGFDEPFNPAFRVNAHEVLFNHENYGSYTTIESSPSYTRPAFNPNVAYQPRVLQLGFRVAF